VFFFCALFADGLCGVVGGGVAGGKLPELPNTNIEDCTLF
jgi:hypothetical protein